MEDNMADFFDLIPANELRVDQPDFKASIWMRNNGSDQRAAWYSVCYAWEGGKWEGFVSIRPNRPSKDRKPLPASLTDCLV
jgi:hypothetical protein